MLKHLALVAGSFTVFGSLAYLAFFEKLMWAENILSWVIPFICLVNIISSSTSFKPSEEYYKSHLHTAHVVLIFDTAFSFLLAGAGWFWLATLFFFSGLTTFGRFELSRKVLNAEKEEEDLCAPGA